jgi:hypothetical protein
MTFAVSTSPDITESIPAPLSLSRKITAGIASQGVRFDVTIGGIGFLLAASDQRPYVRQTAPIQKPQLDTSKEAGEHTLDGEWVRSQTSWHRGAGVRFYEPWSDFSNSFRAVSEYRFDDSLGVDVFTQDQATLLKSCSVVGAVTSGQSAYVTGAVVGGADVLFTNENSVIHRRSSTGANLQTYTASFGAPTGPIAVGGAKIYVGVGGFGINSADASGTALATLYTQAVGATPTPYWVKSRLIAARGTSLYELAPDGTSGTTPGDLDTVTPTYTHPDSNWTWSGVAESPSAILASGYSNGRSAIYRFSLIDAGSGTIPKLSQAYQAAEFPVGEEVLSIRVHLGTYIGIGTTKGMRVGIIAANGDIQYGPLIVSGVAVRSITSADRFFYGAVTAGQPDGKSGLVCVDLSDEIVANSLQFPYAWHARTGSTGRVDSVSVLGASGRVAMGVFGEGSYLQSDTAYETSGWVRSGRIRYSTVSPKKFRSADLGVSIPAGSVGFYVVQPDGDEIFVRNLTASSANGRNISLSEAGDPQEYLQFKVLLTSGSGQSPVLDSLQVRAIPVPTRQELIQYPLLCMDREVTSTGVRTGRQSQPGKPGYAFTRFQALKQLERDQALVTITDRETCESYEAGIETVEFRQPGPPSTDGRPNWGGYLIVTARKFS